MTISLDVTARIRGTVSASPDSGSASAPILETAGGTLADGTGADQANAVFVDAFSITTGSNQTWDLAGSLTDPLNATKVFTAVKTIMIEADATNTTDLTFGNATNGFVGPFDDATATLTLKPGGCVLLHNPSAAGWAVAAGTADTLKIANGSGATATGRITVIGEA